MSGETSSPLCAMSPARASGPSLGHHSMFGMVQRCHRSRSCGRGVALIDAFSGGVIAAFDVRAACGEELKLWSRPGGAIVSEGAAAVRARLLYVEDDPAIAAMTVEVLSEFYDVDHVSDGESGVTLALQRRYEVMVVDRRLPGLTGLDVVRAVRAARITTPILMLTALGTVDDRVSGLDGGANDYLVKPFDYDELLARLRSLRRAFRAEGLRRSLGEWVFSPESQVLYDPTGYRIALTATESALLELLSASPDHVFSRSEILRAVFSERDTSSSVDTYVHYVRRKSTPDIIETVRARGYRAGNPS